MEENGRKLRLKKRLRLVKLVDGMREGKSFQQIADECGCSYHTVERDFKEWKDNGGFDKWLFSEFMLLHDDEVQKEKGSQAYKVIAELLKKRLREQSELEVKGETSIVIKAWDLGNAPDKPSAIVNS